MVKLSMLDLYGCEIRLELRSPKIRVWYTHHPNFNNYNSSLVYRDCLPLIRIIVYSPASDAKSTHSHFPDYNEHIVCIHNLHPVVMACSDTFQISLIFCILIHACLKEGVGCSKFKSFVVKLLDLTWIVSFNS